VAADREQALAEAVEAFAGARGHEARRPLRERIRALAAGHAPALARHLGHRNAFTRWEVVNLLGELAEQDTAAHVVAFALGEDEVHARWRAFWAVTRFDRARTLPLLFAALSAEPPGARWRAALILSMLDRREAVPVLLAGLDSDDEWIRWEALNGLRALRPAGAEVKILPQLAPGVPRALRTEAVLVLGAIGSHSARAALRGALRDADPQVRWRASMGLARSAHGDDHEALRQAWARESEPEVRAQFERDIATMEARHG
jgi:HEAT repeat protein